MAKYMGFVDKEAEKMKKNKGLEYLADLLGGGAKKVIDAKKKHKKDVEKKGSY